ncbi:hypothetical protein FB451DRAFT_1207852 [Mycena latifolia]|nr:hypothetical protein FB451DRAFT_1207852 [Mycena latifolia]
MAAPEISQRFWATDADITILSSDGVIFKVHRKNLEVHSPVFASAGSTTLPENGGEPVQLSETSAILDLLFQFMYPQPQPDLQVLEFETFAGLAEAAEKYTIHSALTLCRMRMKDSIPGHPLEVLDYAVRHGHTLLADESARQSMGHRVSEAMRILTPDTFKTWILVQERWHQKTSECLSDMLYSTSGHNVSFVRKCLGDPNPWYKFREEVASVAATVPYASRTLKEIMELKFTTPEEVAADDSDSDDLGFGLFD